MGRPNRGMWEKDGFCVQNKRNKTYKRIHNMDVFVSPTEKGSRDKMFVYFLKSCILHRVIHT